MPNFIFRLGFMIWLFSQGITALAGSPHPQCQAPCTASGWEFSVSLGLGLSSNPLKDGRDIPLLVRPRVSYSGERVFLDNYEAGVMLWENASHQVNFLIMPSLEQLYFRRWQRATSGLAFKPSDAKGNESDGAPDPVNQLTPTLHHRHTSAIGGLEYNLSLDGVLTGLEFNGQFLEELSGYYGGREIRLAVSRDFFRHWRASLGANFQSQEYVNYYYGVTTSEASRLFNPYNPSDGGWSSLVRLEYLRPISPHLAIRGGATFKQFSSAVADSPLLEKSSVHSFFLGGVYYF